MRGVPQRFKGKTSLESHAQARTVSRLAHALATAQQARRQQAHQAAALCFILGQEAAAVTAAVTRTRLLSTELSDARESLAEAASLLAETRTCMLAAQSKYEDQTAALKRELAAAKALAGSALAAAEAAEAAQAEAGALREAVEEQALTMQHLSDEVSALRSAVCSLAEDKEFLEAEACAKARAHAEEGAALRRQLAAAKAVAGSALVAAEAAEAAQAEAEALRAMVSEQACSIQHLSVEVCNLSGEVEFLKHERSCAARHDDAAALRQRVQQAEAERAAAEARVDEVQAQVLSLRADVCAGPAVCAACRDAAAAAAEATARAEALSRELAAERSQRAAAEMAAGVLERMLVGGRCGAELALQRPCCPVAPSPAAVALRRGMEEDERCAQQQLAAVKALAARMGCSPVPSSPSSPSACASPSAASACASAPSSAWWDSPLSCSASALGGGSPAWAHAPTSLSAPASCGGSLEASPTPSAAPSKRALFAAEEQAGRAAAEDEC
ncbi:hypothetical protein HYH03_018511 [Edaphochlamys debaryana]|uniref:Uncharacterized protein n=1 Tax=Edaphochlamys debaryana TaxID=47281 RepID=A0A835XDM3_9CHLO|nr:hypothetical protein HYH03_018511 [Edaphochlamys debaryana]|eukprot:KAG2482552.1 hypothetical protein HYH03_018511 [Edaphochlamys debaryana]